MKHTNRPVLNLPRVPLPRQTGGWHKTVKGQLDRKAKHKGNRFDRE